MSIHISLAYNEYQDRVLAGWIGKSIGGVIGARLECHKELKNLPLGDLWPDKMVPNDDLDLQVLWLEALQERGIHLTSQDLLEIWQDRCWYFFCEYGVFLNNVQRGILPPLSGIWNNTYFKHSEGCPIRAEIWGYIAAGNPSLAAELARLDGQLDHGEISIQAEQFLAAAAAQSLVNPGLDEALAAGLSVIPAESPLARAVPRVKEIAARYPDTRQAWRVVIREFGNRNANDAVANHALVLLALYAGKGDFKRTMQLCANFGWDTDCTASTAGALLGSLGGTAALPADWIEKLGKNLICGIEVKHKDATLAALANDTCLIGAEMALTRNPAVIFTGAPAAIVRPVPAPKANITVAYAGQPVLWNERCTEVLLTVHNPHASELRGDLRITLPPNIRCEPTLATITVPASGSTVIRLAIRRKTPGGWLPDKNLFKAILTTGGETHAIRTFGLGGARQWQVYGPYWDMWDKTKNPVCPYNNPENVSGPFMVNLTGDCYNHYVRSAHPYLHETTLLSADIPDEVPLILEHGEDHIASSDLGGFEGQGCYYLVRTLRSSLPDQKARLMLGRSGPYCAWLDGVEIGRSDELRGWAMIDDVNLNITFTGRPQRLVIKLVRLTDVFDVSLFFIIPGIVDRKGGKSNLHDCLEDLVPVTAA